MVNNKYPSTVIRMIFLDLSKVKKQDFEETFNYSLGLFGGLLIADVITVSTFTKLRVLARKMRTNIISLK